jgi:hypothetical protein
MCPLHAPRPCTQNDSHTSTALGRLALVLFQRLHIACATYDTAASLPVSSSVEQLLRKYKAVLLENMLSISTGYDSHEHWQAAK